MDLDLFLAYVMIYCTCYHKRNRILHKKSICNSLTRKRIAQILCRGAGRGGRAESGWGCAGAAPSRVQEVQGLVWFCLRVTLTANYGVK